MPAMTVITSYALTCLKHEYSYASVTFLIKYYRAVVEGGGGGGGCTCHGYSHDKYNCSSPPQVRQLCMKRFVTEILCVLL